MGVPPEQSRPRRVGPLALFAVALVAVAVAVAAIAGVGPFDGEGEGDELTADELIAQGDEICTEGRERFAELQEDPPKSAAEAAELTRQLIEITEGEIDDLRALNAPADLEAPLNDYLDSREAGVEILSDGLEAAENEDADAYAEAQAQIARSQVDRARLAEEVGFTECSRPLTAQSGSGEASQ
jgi:hypothetical protein